MTIALNYWIRPFVPGAQTQAYTYFLRLDPGVELAGATVTVVDPDNSPIVGADLTIENVSFGVYSVPANVWGVTFYPRNGSLQVYRLRCRFTTNETPPDAQGSDRTMRLLCAYT